MPSCEKLWQVCFKDLQIEKQADNSLDRLKASFLEKWDTLNGDPNHLKNSICGHYSSNSFKDVKHPDNIVTKFIGYHLWSLETAGTG